MDLGRWEGRTRACLGFCVRVMSGKGAHWGCVDRGRNEQPGQSVQNAPVLPSCSPRALWQVAPCLAISPIPGWRGAGFRALGQAGEGSPGEAWLPLSSPPLEPGWKEDDPGGRQGSRDLGMETVGVWDFLTLAVPEASSALRMPLPVTPGLPSTPPPSCLPSCRHLALNLGRVGERVRVCSGRAAGSCHLRPGSWEPDCLVLSRSPPHPDPPFHVCPPTPTPVIGIQGSQGGAGVEAA